MSTSSWGGSIPTQRCDTAADEQAGAYRRRYGADAEVHDQHQAEMYRIHADRGCDRQEDRRENQNCGSQIQEHAHDEKEYVHDQEDDVSVAGNAHQSIGDRTRNAREGHNVGHDRGCRNQEQDGRGADHRICEHVIVIAEGDLTIADRKNRAVQDAVLSLYEKGGMNALKPKTRGRKEREKRLLSANQESEIQKLIRDKRWPLHKQDQVSA